MGNNIMQRTAIKYDGETLSVFPLPIKTAEWLAENLSPYSLSAIIGVDTQDTGSAASVTVHVRHDSPWINFVMPKFIAMTVATNEDNGYA